MAEESMKVVIGADVTGANNAMKLLQGQIERLQKLLSLPNLSFKQYERLNEMLRKTQTEFNRVQTASKSLAGGTNSAAFALQNLGRVAQDVPFGFIGIANNLNPLLESFQRLRVETGSNKAALAALGSSLMGAGGIGLALSAVTAIMGFVTIGFDAWTRGMGKSKKAQEEHTKAVEVSATAWEQYKQKLEETVKAIGQESAKVQILFGALGDTNIKLEERKSIISQLNSISGKYLGHLDAEKSSYQEISKAVETYLKDMATAAEIKALLPGFEKFIQQMVAAQVELNQLRRTRGFAGIFGEDEEFFKEEEKRLLGTIQRNVNDIKSAKKFLESLAGSGLALEEILFGKKDQALKDVKEVRDTLEEELKQLFRTSTIIKPTKDQTTIARMARGILDDWDKFTEELKAPKEITLGLKINAIPVQKQLVDVAKTINDATQSMLASLAEGLGETIGELLGGGFKSALAAFMGLLGGAIQAIGRAVIQAAASMIVLKKALDKLFLRPELALAVGIGLVALGALIKSKIPKFAEGGIVTRPTLGLFGEAGPEAVIPLHKMNGLGGGMVNVQGEFRIRGRDLVAVVATGQRTLNSIT